MSQNFYPPTILLHFSVFQVGISLLRGSGPRWEPLGSIPQAVCARDGAAIEMGIESRIQEFVKMIGIGPADHAANRRLE